MVSIVFATNNQNKVLELQAALASRMKIITLRDAGIDIDIPEPFMTLHENAREKSITIHRLTGMDCFGEDTGLEVDALGGEPGVLSARYAGDEKDFDKNISKLLTKLGSSEDRSARFRTVISLIWNGNEHYFEGICEGTITHNRLGRNGFGYDAVFMPSGTKRTFAEMSLEEKNEFSHRRKAAEKLIEFLKTQTS